MEDKLNSGYKLYAQKDNETGKVKGVYILETNNSKAKIYTKDQELDFLRILPTIYKKIIEGDTLIMGKANKKYFACLTNKEKNVEIEQNGAYNDYCLNTLVDLEEKITLDNVVKHTL